MLYIRGVIRRTRKTLVISEFTNIFENHQILSRYKKTQNIFGKKLYFYYFLSSSRLHEFLIFLRMTMYTSHYNVYFIFQAEYYGVPTIFRSIKIKFLTSGLSVMNKCLVYR